MITGFLGWKNGGKAALALCMMLSACEDSEVILPGKREAISAIYEKSGVQAAEKIVYRPLPFKAPKLKSNLNWPQGHANPKTRTSNATFSATPNLLWSEKIGTGDVARARLSADPIVYEGLIFTLDSQMVLNATTSSGANAWSKDLTPKSERSGQADGGGLAAGDGKLFVSTGYGTLWALDLKSGTIIWKQSLLGTGNSQPAYRDGIVYLISNDATTWAVDAKNGRVRWQIDGLADVNNATGTSGPAVSEKYVVFGFGSGEVQTAFRKGGLVLWSSTLAGGRAGLSLSTIEDIGSTPVVSEGRVFAANSTGRIVALNLDSGKRYWSAPYGAKSLIWPAGGSVFFVSDLAQLMRLDARSGKVIWAKELPGYLKLDRRRSKEVVVHHGPILAGGALYVASSDGSLTAFDPASGEALRTVAIPGGATTNPVVADKTLYVVSKTGKLHAFR